MLLCPPESAMKPRVSKARAKKVKKRAKAAEKAGAGATAEPLLKKSSLGTAIGLAMWLTALLLLDVGENRQFLVDVPSTGNLLANALLLLIALAGCAVALHMIRPGILRQNSRLLLIFLVTLLTLIPSHFLLYFVGPGTILHIADPTVGHFLIPIALTPLLLTILTDRRVGLVAGIWVTIAASTLAGHDPAVLLTGSAVTTVTCLLASNLRQRVRVFRVGLVIGATSVLCALTLWILRRPGEISDLFLQQALAGLVNGLASALFAIVLLPIFETMFKITTDITLLELSDLGHPLLQRLAIQAPGTYHHSLVVANLSQAAADEIGANGLQARVCSYYHDIGKLTKPDYFVENMQFRDNPHDELTPTMSTVVITSHVKDGVELAYHHKLPKPVVDVIREHHGTGLVTYFHHKAKTQVVVDGEPANGKGTVVAEEDFRYPGPKPQSRESGIIHLADGIESASRTLQKTTPASIEGLVNEIINDRIVDTQLDQCDLKFDELGRVKRAFIFTLTNMLHSRIAYPKDDNRDHQSAERESGEPKETGRADTTYPVASRSN